VHGPGRLRLSRRCGRSRRVAAAATSAGRAWGSPSPRRPRRYRLIDTSALIEPPVVPDLTAFAAHCRNLAAPFSRRRSLGSDRIQWHLGHGGAAGLSRGEPLQGLAQLDGVDPAFPICDEGIGVSVTHSDTACSSSASRVSLRAERSNLGPLNARPIGIASSRETLLTMTPPNLVDQPAMSSAWRRKRAARSGPQAFMRK
jgi:hypothetical protein